jgi:DNA-binding CsgD family transcriptional regulator
LSYAVVLRSEHLGDFTECDHGSFQVVLRNMMRALSVHTRLAGVAALKLALFDALDRAGLAAFAVDDDSRLVSHNAIAAALLKNETILQTKSGILSARHSAADRQLTLAVVAACHRRQGQTVILPRSGSDSPPLVGLVMPIASEDNQAPFLRASHSGRHAIILVKDPSRFPKSDVNVLHQLFGLTTAEARLTGELASGKSLEEISQERNVRYSTLRAQLRAVMSKTETRRQGELIALATRHAAVNFRPIERE